MRIQAMFAETLGSWIEGMRCFDLACIAKR